MKCYEHAQSNVDREAVAVCAECGMGLCMEHVNRVEARSLGRSGMRPVVPTSHMHILCRECAEALQLSGDLP